MFPFWIILGTVALLAGIFHRQILRLLGIRLMSEMMTTSSLKHSTQTIEQLGRWLLTTLGIGFLILGLGNVLPNELSYRISIWLLRLSGLMLFAMIGLTLANWRAR